MKTRPLTSAMSTCRVRPPAIAATAWSRSSGMPASFAKWLSVPSGSTPSGMSVPATAAAAVLIVPSPPAATSASTPAASAASVQWRSISSGATARILASMPCASNSGRSLSALSSPNEPPPRLMITRTFNRCGSIRSWWADAEGAELVPLGIAKIAAVEGAIALLAAHAGGAAVHDQRHHVAVADGGGLAIVRPRDGDARLPPAAAVEGEAARQLHQPVGPDQVEQGIVEAPRLVEIVGADR